MSHLDLRVLFNGGIFYRYNGFDNFFIVIRRVDIFFIVSCRVFFN